MSVVPAAGFAKGGACAAYEYVLSVDDAVAESCKDATPLHVCVLNERRSKRHTAILEKLVQQPRGHSPVAFSAFTQQKQPPLIM